MPLVPAHPAHPPLDPLGVLRRRAAVGDRPVGVILDPHRDGPDLRRPRGRGRRLTQGGARQEGRRQQCRPEEAANARRSSHGQAPRPSWRRSAGNRRFAAGDPLGRVRAISSGSGRAFDHDAEADVVRDVGGRVGLAIEGPRLGLARAERAPPDDHLDALRIDVDRRTLVDQRIAGEFVADRQLGVRDVGVGAELADVADHVEDVLIGLILLVGLHGDRSERVVELVRVRQPGPGLGARRGEIGAPGERRSRRGAIWRHTPTAIRSAAGRRRRGRISAPVR